MQPSEFDLHARLEDHHWWFRARREIVGDVLTRHLARGARSRILEVGCGTGGNLRFLAARHQVMGTEVDAYAARLARARTGLDIREGVLREAMRGADFVPDAVLLLDVLEHVEDDRGLLDSALALLPPGGLVVLTVPADPKLWSAHDVALGHLRRYSAASLSRLWNGLPASARKLTAINVLLCPLIRFARGRRRARTHGGSDLAPVSPVANALLYRMFAAERHVLRWWSFSRGCSLLAVLEKR